MPQLESMEDDLGNRNSRIDKFKYELKAILIKVSK
jgi:hypothetical protein